MTQLEEAVFLAALHWSDAVTMSLQTTRANEELAPEELTLYQAVCAWRAAQGDANAKRA